MCPVDPERSLYGIERIDHALPRFANAAGRWGLAGAHFGFQLYVSRHRHTVIDEAVGWMDTKYHFTPDTLAVWLSACKPVTAVSLLQQVARGRCELDDPVAAHVPGFDAHGKGNITLRHLLTHTAGIRNADIGWKPRPWEEAIALICAARPEPNWIPGEKAGYHVDASWYMLGEVIRRLSGKPLAHVLREEVLEACGARSSWVGMSEDEAKARATSVCALYDTSQVPAVERSLYREPRILASGRPGGNGRGPVRDLARFYEALLFDSPRLLPPELRAMMTSRQRRGMIDHTFRHVIDWGLGIMINSEQVVDRETLPYGFGQHASPETFGHGGNQCSTGFADPRHGLVVALAFNGQPGDTAHRQRMFECLTALYADLGLTSD